jgi:glycosyltransferase involved in cell wall biosynthesis
MVRASICIAAYNGEKFIAEQIDSIINQIKHCDEIIIVDDVSKDKTRDILRKYRDDRILLHFNEVNIGACATFEKAIGLARGEFIVLADQDDVWVANRLEKMCALLKEKIGVVSSNFCLINSKGEQVQNPTMRPLSTKQSSNFTSNILKLFLGRMQYFGSAMAFNAQLKDIILPFPAYVEAHDHWIAIAGNLVRSNIHLEDITLKRRIHGSNLSSKKRSFFSKMYSRVIFVLQTGELLRRIVVTNTHGKRT